MQTKLERTVKATVVLEGKEVDWLISILSRARGSALLMEFSQKLLRELQGDSYDPAEDDD